MKPVLFTCLAPEALQHQLGCMATWRPHVAAVVTVNHRLEAPNLVKLPDWVVPFQYEENLQTGPLEVPMQRFAEAISRPDNLLFPALQAVGYAGSKATHCGTIDTPMIVCSTKDCADGAFDSTTCTGHE